MDSTGQYRRKVRRFHPPQEDYDSQPLYIQVDAGLYMRCMEKIFVSLVSCKGCGLQALCLPEAGSACVFLLWLASG